MLLQVNIYRLFNLTRKSSVLDILKLETHYILCMPASLPTFTIKKYQLLYTNHLVWMLSTLFTKYGQFNSEHSIDIAESSYIR
jgi:hypothetical protein